MASKFAELCVKRLFAFGRFADDAQRILTAVHGLADVILEGSLNCFPRIGFELGIAAFTNADHHGKGFYDAEFSLRHDYSLARKSCANEMAPVPVVQPKSKFSSSLLH